MGDDLERLQRSLGESDDPDCRLQDLAVERPRVHEAELDVPDGSPRNDARESERGCRNASQQRQGIRREHDALSKVPAKDGRAQTRLLRQEAHKRCVKFAGRGELCEPEGRTHEDVRDRAIEEEGELCESVHVVQRALELVEE